MNSQTIVKKIAKSAGIRNGLVQTIVALFLDGLVEELEAGNKVLIKGLGSFTWRKAPARSIKLPRTGEVLNVPERLILKFNPAQKLRRRHV